MKKYLFAILVLALGVPVLRAQEEQPTVTDEGEAPAPKIVCEEPVFNFGERDQNDTVEHTFMLRNEGNTTLEIGKVRTSCGCTVANVSSRQVEPGGETEVTARLSLKNRRGKQRKAITVESNDPVTPKLSLYLEGEATSQIEVTPNRVFFGQIEEDAAVTGEVSIVSRMNDPLVISKVDSSSPHFAQELITLEEGKSYKVRVSTVNPLPRGSLRGNVRVTTDSTRYPVIDISVSATVLDELMVAPTQIVLPAKGDEPVSRYIVIRPGRTKTFAIEEVDVPVPTMTSHITALGSNGYQIRVENIVANAELDGAKVTILTDVEGMKEIEVPFRVIGASPSQE